MHYLLDGYNLAHWLAGDADLAPEALRRALLARLGQDPPRDASAIDVYWDTRVPGGVMPPNEYLGWCTLHYVDVADDAIVDAVAAADDPRRLVVVSRDREVTGRSRQLGARVLAPGELLGRR